MNNKKGFVLVETIVVLAVLTVGLALIYNSYSKVMNASTTSNSYDLATDLYKANAIKELYNANGIVFPLSHNVISYNLNTRELKCYTGTISSENYKNITYNNCAGTSSEAIKNLDNFYNNLGISKITIVKNSLLEANNLYFFDGSTIEYFKSIDLASLKSQPGYIIVVNLSNNTNERISSVQI